MLDASYLKYHEYNHHFKSYHLPIGNPLLNIFPLEVKDHSKNSSLELLKTNPYCTRTIVFFGKTIKTLSLDLHKVGPVTSYKWGYGAPINGLDNRFPWCYNSYLHLYRGH